MNKWQEFAEQKLMYSLTEYQLRRAIIRALDDVETPEEAAVKLYRIIDKIKELTHAIDKVAAQEAERFSSSQPAPRAVTGEL